VRVLSRGARGEREGAAAEAAAARVCGGPGRARRVGPYGERRRMGIGVRDRTGRGGRGEGFKMESLVAARCLAGLFTAFLSPSRFLSGSRRLPPVGHPAAGTVRCVSGCADWRLGPGTSDSGRGVMCWWDPGDGCNLQFYCFLYTVEKIL
jgi:hypothetical protein